MSEPDTKVLTGDELYEKYKIYDVDYASIGTNFHLLREAKQKKEMRKHNVVAAKKDARDTEVKSYVDSVIQRFKLKIPPREDPNYIEQVLSILQVTEDQDPKITINKLTFLLGFFSYMYCVFLYKVTDEVYKEVYEPVHNAIASIRISIADKYKLEGKDRENILGDLRYTSATHLFLPVINMDAGGSKSRRIRRRKHNRKTHHKHARKTHHKRASKTYKRRRHSRAVRKHKKHTRR
jgi:hypothetical protein